MRFLKANYLSQNLSQWPRTSAVFILIAVTAIVYFGSLFSEFVWDDFFLIVDNDFIKSAKNIPSIFTRKYLTLPSDLRYVGIREIGSAEMSYRPVVTLSYFFDYFIWKLKPFGYHLHNLILHLVNVALLFILIEKVTQNKKIAWLTSLLFAVHPVNVEAVCAIANRDDLLTFLFMMLTFIFFLKLEKVAGNKKVVYYFLSCFCFFVALFAKEMAVMLLFLLILYDYFFITQRQWGKWVARFKTYYLGYLSILIFYLIVRFYWMANESGPMARYLGGSFVANIFSMIRVVATYIQWLIWPGNIYIVLPEDLSWDSSSLFNGKVLIALSSILVCWTVAILTRKTNKNISWGIWWFFITLIPVLNIIPIQNFMASRYLYIPSVGFCLVIAVLLAKLSQYKMPLAFLKNSIGKEKVNKVLVIIPLIMILSFYTIFTMERISTWKDGIPFIMDLVRRYPDNSRMRCILGQYYSDNGWEQLAINEYKESIRLNPNYGKAYLCLGISYKGKRMFNKAIVLFLKALELNPRLWQIHFNLGEALLRKGANKEAIRYFREGLDINPNNLKALNNLGVAFFKMNNKKAARRVWERALEIDPNYESARRLLNRLSN